MRCCYSYEVGMGSRPRFQLPPGLGRGPGSAFLTIGPNILGDPSFLFLTSAIFLPFHPLAPQDALHGTTLIRLSHPPISVATSSQNLQPKVVVWTQHSFPHVGSELEVRIASTLFIVPPWSQLVPCSESSNLDLNIMVEMS